MSDYGKYYLIGLKGHPWIIGLQGHRTVDQAWRAYHWQLQGTAEPGNQVVCERVARTQFKAIDSETTYDVTERDCFTQVAWDEFLNSWKEDIYG